MSYEPKRFDFSIPVRINLSSDTQTKPTRAMKEAMMEAEVGDEQLGSDPTVWALCDRSAALLGKEAAVFLPIGHDVQPGGDRDALPAGRGNPRARIFAHHIQRRRCAGGDRGRADQRPDRRAWHVHRGHAGRSDPAGLALFADADDWWRWNRPPTAVAARAGASRRCMRSPRPRTRMACPPTWMARG